MKKKLPPYSKNLSNFKCQDDIVIYTGSNAWLASKRVTWQPSTPKLVLPPGDDPSIYRWPVSGRYVQVWTCGEPEPGETLFTLARLLLQAGAVKALLLDLKKPVVVIEPDLSMEAAA